MVELNKIEKRVIVLVLAAVLAVVCVRWRQVEKTRVELSAEAAGSSVETEGNADVQR